jgi:NADH dehydrogenase FAD-containing subunit
MIDIDFLPPHLIILGGSYIGLEFAQAYRRFGSDVTVLELAPRLIAREDEDVSHAVADFLKEEGIDVRIDSKVVGVEKQGNSIAVKVESAGKVSQVVGTHMLVADRSAAEYGRSWPIQRWHRDRFARLYSSRRSVAHQRARYLGNGRLQWPGRVYPHVVE